MPRLTGATLSLKLGPTPTEYNTDLTNYVLTNEESDSDVTTFADASNGGARTFKLKGSAVQDISTTGFWTYVWTNTGEEVAYTIAPYGNAIPSTSQPHFTGTAIIGPKPDLGGDAGSSNTFTFDFEWTLTGEPTKVTSGS